MVSLVGVNGAVGAAIADAWAKRRLPRHFVAKLSDALGEAQETIVWLDVASECGYLKEPEHGQLAVTARRTRSGLVRMMQRPEQWCIPLRIPSTMSPRKE